MSDPDEANARLVVQELRYLEEEFGDKEWPFSGKGGLDEVPVPAGAACVKASSALAAVSKNVYENTRDLIRKSPMYQKLAAAIEDMNPEDGEFALLLTHKYTRTNIAPSGSRALKGVDHERFLALEEANNSVSTEKKLQFHIVQLDHYVNFFGRGNVLDRYRVEWHEEKVAWYSLDGKYIGIGDEIKLKFNFLNPGMGTYSQFWQPYGRSVHFGEEGTERNRVYTRFALVAWPTVRNVECTMKFVNLRTGFEALQEQGPVDAATLSHYMKIAITKLSEMDAYEVEKRKLGRTAVNDFPPPISGSTCQVLCQLLQQADDPTLVVEFFSQFFSRLGEKLEVDVDITNLLNKFDWCVVGEAFLKALRCATHPTCQYLAYIARTALEMARELEQGKAQQALLSLVVEWATSVSDETLFSSISLKKLWHQVFCHGNDRTLHELSQKLQQANPQALGPVLERYGHYLDDDSFPLERKALLVAIMFCRIEWLKKQVQVLDKPFSWEMPVAEFPEYPILETFLRGSRVVTCTTTIRAHSLSDRPGARRWSNASFNIEARRDYTYNGEFVKITKTREWYDKHRENLPNLKKELSTQMDAMVETLVHIVLNKG